MIETLKNMKRSFVSSGANSYDPNVKSAACAEGADLYISKARDSLKSQNLMATSEHLQKAEDEFINNNDNHDVAVRQLCEIHVIVDTTLMISKLKEAKDQHRPPSPQ